MRKLVVNAINVKHSGPSRVLLVAGRGLWDGQVSRQESPSHGRNPETDSRTETEEQVVSNFGQACICKYSVARILQVQTVLEVYRSLSTLNVIPFYAILFVFSFHLRAHSKIQVT